MAIFEYWYRYKHYEIDMLKISDIPDDQRDPQSLSLIGHPYIRDMERNLATDVTRQLDSEALRAEVLKSQWCRFFIQQAMSIDK